MKSEYFISFFALQEIIDKPSNNSGGSIECMQITRVYKSALKQIERTDQLGGTEGSSAMGNRDLQKKVGAEDEGEEEFVLLKQGATHVTVQVVGEVVNQVSQPLLQDLGLVTETQATCNYSTTEHPERQKSSRIAGPMSLVMFMSHLSWMEFM